MTTPHPAISEAREASQVLCDCVPLTLNDKANPALDTIDAVISLAESQALEIKRLTAQNSALTQNVKDLDQVICDTAKEIGCVPDNEVMLESVSALKTERDRLKAALESAKTVIAPFAHPVLAGMFDHDAARMHRAGGSLGESELIVPLPWDMGREVIDGLSIKVADLIAAAQWCSRNALEER